MYDYPSDALAFHDNFKYSRGIIKDTYSFTPEEEHIRKSYRTLFGYGGIVEMTGWSIRPFKLYLNDNEIKPNFIKGVFDGDYKQIYKEPFDDI